MVFNIVFQILFNYGNIVFIYLLLNKSVSVSGVAAIVSVMPPSEITVVLRELCFMQLTPLAQLIEQDAVSVKGTTTDPVLWLDRLSSILRHISVHNLLEGEL